MRTDALRSRPRRSTATMAALLLAGAMLWPVVAGAAASGTAHVTYLAGASVYMDAGRLDGVGLGDTVTVTRNGASIAVLRVAFVSSPRASCDTLSVARTIVVGDVVTFAVRSPDAEPDEMLPQAEETAEPRPRERSRSPLRGRAGMRMLAVTHDVSGDRTELMQPGFDLRLDGALAEHATLAIDVRSRYTTRTVLGASTTESAVRAYRGSIALSDATGHKRLVAGRQSAAAVSTISLFDGVLAEIDAGGGAIGAFGGVLPEPGTLAVSGEVSQFGLFYRLRGVETGALRWNLSLGGASSWQSGQSNRDFLFAQASWTSARLSGWLAQEVDVNRGWKREAGEPMFSATNTFVSLRAPIASRVALYGGFDNRRNVRLYRDRLTPETEFDDRYRQGAWLGASVEPVRGARLDGNVRRTDGGDAGSGTSWSSSASWRVVAGVPMSLRARLARHDDDRIESRVESLAFGLDPASLFRLEITGGRRTTRDPAWDLESVDHWQDASLDVGLGARVYLNVTTEHDDGDGGSLWQHAGGLLWRF